MIFRLLPVQNVFLDLCIFCRSQVAEDRPSFTQILSCLEVISPELLNLNHEELIQSQVNILIHYVQLDCITITLLVTHRCVCSFVFPSPIGPFIRQHLFQVGP